MKTSSTSDRADTSLPEDERRRLFDIPCLMNGTSAVPANFSTTVLTEEEMAYLALVEQDAIDEAARHKENRVSHQRNIGSQG